MFISVLIPRVSEQSNAECVYLVEECLHRHGAVERRDVLAVELRHTEGGEVERTAVSGDGGSLTHSFIHSPLTHSLIHSFIHLFIHWIIDLLVCWIDGWIDSWLVG